MVVNFKLILGEVTGDQCVIKALGSGSKLCSFVSVNSLQSKFKVYCRHRKSSFVFRRHTSKVVLDLFSCSKCFAHKFMKKSVDAQVDGGPDTTTFR